MTQLDSRLPDETSGTNSPARRPFCRRAGIASAAVVAIVVVSATVAAMRLDDPSAPRSASTDRESTPSALPVCVVRAGTLAGPELSSSYAGLLVSQSESVLGFERGGRVARVLVDEGGLVRKGDLIAELEQRDLDASEKRVRGELAAAWARLDELISGPRTETIQAARARVKELAARVELAKLESDRQQQLAPRGATSRSELDAAVFGLQASESSLLAAQAELEELVAGTRKEQIAAQRAQCEAIAARLEEIESQRDDSAIVAPFDGTVAQRMIDEGTVVAAGTEVVRLVSNGCEAQVGLPPAVAARLQPGDPVRLELRDATRDATIDRIEPTVRRETRTRVVFARFAARQETAASDSADRRDSGWIAGEVIGLRIALNDPSDLHQKYWLPSTALVRGGKGLWAVLVAPGDASSVRCERRSVELLKTDGSKVLVQGMLTRGDRVIAQGVHRLTAGMNVQPIGPASVEPSEQSP